MKCQGASGDFHPLHHDETYAVAAGFPSVFSVGMFQAGLLATFATDWLGADTIRRYTMRFQEQCWPTDVLTCAGVVTDVTPEPRRSRRIAVELTCTRQTGDGARVQAATISVPSGR